MVGIRSVWAPARKIHRKLVSSGSCQKGNSALEEWGGRET